MTRIDFYSLDGNSGGDRFLLACRLVERIRATGARVLIHCPDPGQAQHLDRLLWTFREDSFLPHGRVGHTDLDLTPVLISGDGSPETEDHVLINLSNEVPEFFGRFERLCEPIDHDPAARLAGRERFRYYRDRGYPLEHHEIRL
ncbi:DNA polymerase III subunit chi [Thiocapsa roseopersicina]|uniref:DNA polymerase III, chi subunit n=1 Tax=Thiocapsa roseopersicina TaxID=1058 RepID=A0A1H2TXV0_THIRO|nr:DNA polymerase III subunit chi [Thiocapsa roseopersicina]SDW48598.1 DNA polymerase III, chi subunit [Thiocapsa roseopersicina]